MENRVNFTREELDRAKQVSLTSLAAAMGYTPVRVGSHYSLKEMDSLIIYNDRTWCRWSRKGSGTSERIGGTQIDFVMEFGGFNMVEAVGKLLDFQGYMPPAIERPSNVSNYPSGSTHGMELPEKAKSYRRLYAYLTKTRGLSTTVVNYFVNEEKILYEAADKYHNLVFIGKDINGEVKFATKHGSMTFNNSKAFKGDVPGNNKNYGINIVNPHSDELNVFEAAIDAMSWLDITGNYSTNILVLGMVADNPLRTFLEEHPNIKKINFRLDNDAPAQKQIHGEPEVIDFKTNQIIKEKKEGYLEKYSKKGYLTVDKSAPKYSDSCKDYNDCLKYLKCNYPEKVYALNQRKKAKCI